MATIDQIIDDFEYLTDWEDRYRYVIELGRTLEPLAQDAYNDTNKVRGCASQVWLVSDLERTSADPDSACLTFKGDSDALIVRGLIAILLALYSGRTASAILEEDAQSILERLSLQEHLSPQRSNGLAAMMKRIRADAAAAQSATVSARD